MSTTQNSDWLRFEVVALGNCFFVMHTASMTIVDGAGGTGTIDEAAQRTEADRLNETHQ